MFQTGNFYAFKMNKFDPLCSMSKTSISLYRLKKFDYMCNHTFWIKKFRKEIALPFYFASV